MAKTKRVSTAEAAEIIGVSERRVRQIAEFLHGERNEFGAFTFSRPIIEEYAAERLSRAPTIEAEKVERLEEHVAALEAHIDRLEAVVARLEGSVEHFDETRRAAVEELTR